MALVYAYPSYWPEAAVNNRIQTIKEIVYRINTKLAWEAYRSSAGTRTMSLRVECEWPNPEASWSMYPKVYRVPIDEALIPTRINSEVQESMGTSSFLPEWSDARKFLVFAQNADPSPPGDRVAGIAFVGPNLLSQEGQGKDSAAAARWNTRDQVGIVYDPYWATHTSMHELFHMMGAVASNPGPVLGTGLFHCWAGSSVMCERDNGPRGSLYTPDICPANAPDTLALDCNYWSYFRAGHRYPSLTNGLDVALNGWLEDHWNTAGAENRYVTAFPPWDYEVPCEPCERPRGWPFVE